MPLVKKIIAKCKRIAISILTFPTLLSRYCLYIVSSRSLYSHLLHEFSQLLEFSSRIRTLPGMTSATERAYFQWYAQHIFQGSGVIVDLGCWLGSTTIPLAMGLSKNSVLRTSCKSIHAYDEFIWRPYMEPNVVGTSLEGKFKMGENFLPEFNKRIAPWKDQIVVHSVDLSKVTWNGEGIEFLLIDAMKSWELTNNIIQQFFPALLPGKSLILHQDFAHWFTPWIHLTNYRFRNYFEFVYEVPKCSSVVFKLCKTLPPELTKSTFSQASFSQNEIEEAFSYSLGLVSPAKRPNVAAAKVMLYLHLGELSDARRELEIFRSQGLNFYSDLSKVEKRLSEQERESE